LHFGEFSILAGAAGTTGIFTILFLGLAIVLPVLTKKRTQCSFNKTGAFEVRIDKSKCQPCVLCDKACPTLSIGAESVESGKPRLSCMKCSACVDACVRRAAVWHIKGTPVGSWPEGARLMHLDSAWGFAVMFGGSIIASTLTLLLGLVV